MVTLESTVNRILDTLQSNGVNNQPRNQDQPPPSGNCINDHANEIAIPSFITLIDSQPGTTHLRLTNREAIEKIGKVYMRFCANQPLPLFPMEDFVESLFTRADATLFAIIAVSLRYTRETEEILRFSNSQAFRDAAHSRIMADVGEGNVSICTLQALCLIVLFDFEGKDQNPRYKRPVMTMYLSWSHENGFIASSPYIHACFRRR